MEESRFLQNPQTQDPNHDDEVIDTLSLSDFMVYNDNGDPQDFYTLNDQNLHDFDDQFEFSSELLKTSVDNSVVFCGKSIPYKEPIVSQKKSHKKRWRLARFFKRSSESKRDMIYASEKLDSKYEGPIRRVSILASATKPRWYLLMFGFGSSGFSAQMHIRDLKKRQTSIRVKDHRTDDHMKSNGDGGGSASWNFMTLLGCGGGEGRDHRHPNLIQKT